MRFMWRANGRMVQYTYLPPPLRIGDCGFDLQLSVPRTPPLQAQPYILQDDAWYCVEQEVKLNDAGSANGAVNVWINGIQVLGLSNVVYRTVENWETQIGGIAFDSHFGGGDATWHPSTDQYVYYDNVVLAESRIGCAQQ
jgi:hypothetical protein